MCPGQPVQAATQAEELSLSAAYALWKLPAWFPFSLINGW